MHKKMSKREAALAEYRAEMKAAGWGRISAYISPELQQYLQVHRHRGHCTGSALELAIPGQVTPRIWKKPTR